MSDEKPGRGSKCECGGKVGYCGYNEQHSTWEIETLRARVKALEEALESAISQLKDSVRDSDRYLALEMMAALSGSGGGGGDHEEKDSRRGRETRGAGTPGLEG